MKRPVYLDKIRKRINEAKFGSVFVSTDFTDITDKTTISISLDKLETEGLVKRVLRGVYYKPKYSALLEEYVAPSINLIAHAIARNFGRTIIPYGDAALNLLNLSTQVPAVWIYMCDGNYKEYSYGKITIRFKKTANKDIKNFSPKTALVIQALKALGEKNINENTINKLKDRLTKKEKEKMLKEARITTSWIYEYIKKICLN